MRHRGLRLARGPRGLPHRLRRAADAQRGGVVLIALALGALLAAAPDPGAPFEQAFWAKDLPALVGLLAEPGDPQEDPARAFFGDLVRLVNCEPLPQLAPGAPLRPLRVLMRLEVARRARLGPAAANSPTVWRDILDPSFFNRALGDAGGLLLLWPVEEERWSGEAVRAHVRPSLCAAVPEARTSELELDGPELVSALEELSAADPRFRPALARAAYHRAVLLSLRGDVEGAREAVGHLQADALGEAPLVPYARLFRLELGLDPTEGYLALLGEKLGPAEAVVRLRAAHLLHRLGRWPELEELTRGVEALGAKELCQKGARPERDLVYRRAVALDRLDQGEAFDALADRAFPACSALEEPAVQALRAVALRRWSTSEFKAVSKRVLAAATPNGAARSVWQLGGNALRRANLATAEAAASSLLAARDLPSKTRGWSLEAEIAFWTQDVPRFQRAVRNLFPEDPFAYSRRRDREERDRAAVEFAQAMVTDSEDGTTAPFRGKLRVDLASMKEGASLKREAAFEVLMAALDGRPLPAPDGRQGPSPVAVGEVPVEAPSAVPDMPPVQIAWPEPHSLLAIPAPDGAELWAWFRAPEVPR